MPASPTFSIAVLISGNGSNLQAIIDAIKNNELDATIKLVISNRQNAKGLDRAKEAGIPTLLVDHTLYLNREEFDQAMLDALTRYQPDLVVLAGFMRILSAKFVSALCGKLINIHPSLLPLHKGTHTHKRALEANDSIHGCSIHYVTKELDGGPVIAQSQVPIYPNDTEELLAVRVQKEEHRLYPLCIGLIAKKKLELVDGAPVLDKQPLTNGGIKFRQSNYDTYYLK
ncbi:MAG: phosphoribosylglycinamide formyltransferase [Pseudomonadales bacterium]|nr:phosphoribosylglycinamide formyltransferase [Pseudomonadales bacterium]